MTKSGAASGIAINRLKRIIRIFRQLISIIYLEMIKGTWCFLIPYLIGWNIRLRTTSGALAG
jgi:hypothetical protein